MIEELEGCRIIDKRGIAMVSLIVLLVLTGFEVVFYSDIRSLNQRAYDYFYNSINVELMSLISFTAGGGLVIAVIGLLATDLYRYRRLTRISVGIIFSLALSMIIVFILKITLQVPRPSGGVPNTEGIVGLILSVDSYSFPSGHVARAASIAGYLGSRVDRRSITALLYLWVALVMISRLVLGVHWITDVIASIFVGLFSASITIDLEDRLVNCYERLHKSITRAN